MRKMAQTGRYHVISLRISEKELAAIQALKDGSDLNLSDFMRNIISVFIRDAQYDETDVFHRQANS